MKPLSPHTPRTFEEAVDFLVGILEPADVEFIRANPSSVGVHDTFGRYLRNTWGLWAPATPLVRHFRDRFDVEHPDDISGILLEALWSRVLGRPHDTEAQAARYKAHWAAMDRKPA